LESLSTLHYAGLTRSLDLMTPWPRPQWSRGSWRGWYRYLYECKIS